MKNYNDIINLEHPTSKNHPQMRICDRAAQFAPFAALSGYGEAINETGRMVSNKIILSEGQKEAINGRLEYLKDNLNNQINVNVVYFVKDKVKSGGSYQSKKGIIKKIDEIYHTITFLDKEIINIDDIKSIEARCFDNTEFQFE